MKQLVLVALSWFSMVAPAWAADSITCTYNPDDYGVERGRYGVERKDIHIWKDPTGGHYRLVIETTPPVGSPQRLEQPIRLFEASGSADALRGLAFSFAGGEGTLNARFLDLDPETDRTIFRGALVESTGGVAIPVNCDLSGLSH